MVVVCKWTPLWPKNGAIISLQNLSSVWPSTNARIRTLKDDLQTGSFPTVR